MELFPFSFLILKKFYKGFQMRYRLFFNLNGKAVKTIKTFFPESGVRYNMSGSVYTWFLTSKFEFLQNKAWLQAGNDKKHQKFWYQSHWDPIGALECPFQKSLNLTKNSSFTQFFSKFSLTTNKTCGCKKSSPQPT